MARIELDPWIPEQAGSPVLTRVNQLSAIEAVARRVNMTTDAMRVPRFEGDEVAVVPEGGLIPEAAGVTDNVLLEAVGFKLRYKVSVEDRQDAPIDALAQFRNDFARSFALKYDNAALGVTGAKTGNTRPFNSVYYEVSTNAAGNLVTVGTAATGTTAAAEADLTYEGLSDALGLLEAGNYFSPADTVIVAHPTLLGQLRTLKDANGNAIIQDLNGTPNSIFGYSFRLSLGARTSATATDAPTGNPLIVMGSRTHLINGVRSGPESQFSPYAGWETDEPELKVRARRGFAVGRPQAFVVVEKIQA